MDESVNSVMDDSNPTLSLQQVDEASFNQNNDAEISDILGGVGKKGSCKEAFKVSSMLTTLKSMFLLVWEQAFRFLNLQKPVRILEKDI